MHRTCERLCLPPEPNKDVGPTTCLVFTGIEIDSEGMELRLPADKLIKLKVELSKLARQESLQEEGLAFPDWGTLACLLSGQSRQNIPPETY